MSAVSSSIGPGWAGELQVWDQGCLESLAGVEGIARQFHQLRALVLGHSFTARPLSARLSQEAFSARVGPARLGCLTQLRDLTQLALVSSKFRDGALESVSALTSLKLLMLSEVQLPSEPLATTELRSVVCSLGCLTKLVLRECVVADQVQVAANPSARAQGAGEHAAPELGLPKHLSTAHIVLGPREDGLAPLPYMEALDLKVRFPAPCPPSTCFSAAFSCSDRMLVWDCLLLSARSFEPHRVT